MAFDRKKPILPDGIAPLQRFQFVSLITLLGFLFAIIFCHIMGVHFNAEYPFNTFLGGPNDSWSDIHGFWVHNQNLDPFHTTNRGYGNNYPPFGYLITVPFTLFDEETCPLIYFLFSFTFISWFIWTQIRGVVRSVEDDAWAVIALCFLSYPFLISLDRLNSENIVFALLAGFLLMWQRKKFTASAVFLGAAIGAKAYPLAYFFIFLGYRKYREAAISLLTAVGANVLSLIVYRTGPFEVLDAYQRSAERFLMMTYGPHGLQHSSSLYAAVRILQGLWFGQGAFGLDFAKTTLFVCNVLCFVLTVIYAMAIMNKSLELWEKLMLATAGILLVTPVSFDYKLLHLFLPLTVFLNSKIGRAESIFFCTLFGILIIPKTYFVLFEYEGERVTVNGPINIAILLTMSGLFFMKAFQQHSIKEIEV